MNFSQKVISEVRKIPKGQVLTYKEVAKRVGNIKAVRAVANILAKNKDPKVPCYRVIKSDFSVGGFRGQKRDYWEKASLLLKEGLVGVIPTDTIYCLLGSAFNKKTVEKIYRLKKYDPKKPIVILISSPKDLKKFGVKVNFWQKRILEKSWPGKISFVLKSPLKKFFYLHRRSNTLAFRVPAKKEVLKLLLITGPLVASSANWENYPPATNIFQAKRYFAKKVFYLNGGEITGSPSTLIDLTQNKLEVLRVGAFQLSSLRSFLYSKKACLKIAKKIEWR